MRVAARCRAAWVNSWRRCSRPAAPPAPFGLEVAARHIESVRCFHPGILAGVESTAAMLLFNCRPGRAHPKAALAKVSVARGSVAWLGARGGGGGLSLGYFFGLKGTKKKPCIERPGCPAQLRVALEGPPQKRLLATGDPLRGFLGARGQRSPGTGDL